jgi:hypothetical protein
MFQEKIAQFEHFLKHGTPTSQTRYNFNDYVWVLPSIPMEKAIFFTNFLIPDRNSETLIRNGSKWRCIWQFFNCGPKTNWGWPLLRLFGKQWTKVVSTIFISLYYIFLIEKFFKWLAFFTHNLRLGNYRIFLSLHDKLIVFFFFLENRV